ncbi:uncharacterized protein TNCV_4541231 [Trichonephila clavipes]|nr:uncharacterized protein TNCV_4541231 [Trichonephila clavipes]
MIANPYDVEVEQLRYIGLVQKCMGMSLLGLKSKTEKIKLSDEKSLSGSSRLTDILISKIQTYYSTAIRNNIKDLNSMKTSVWAFYFHLLSSNESPQNGLCPANVNAWCMFQKTEAECTERHYDHKHMHTHAVYHNEFNKANFRDLDGDRFNSCQVIYSQFGLTIQELKPNDHQARRRFVEWAQNEIAVVPDFHKRILFSDEAHFWLNGYVNKQNCRIWSEANPQVYVETPLHPEKLTVWCALWAGGILLQKR